jgi:leader peptidase (prepilin peptidase) / N-methyltransferase
MWGSFLNVVAYRLLQDAGPFGRSRCPLCAAPIAWYDNIPLVSWFLLRRRCRHCKNFISWLYPFIELLTAVIFWLIFIKIPVHYWFGYGALSSALIVAVRTDLEAMLVSRYATLGLIPVGLTFAFFGLLPITVLQSFFGFSSAYIFLYGLAVAFWWVMKKEGMGSGDVELLAGIGAFVGFPGWWFSLMYAAVVGSLVGIFYLVITGWRSNSVRLPFCPFLAVGTWVYLFWPELSSYIL